MHPHFYNLIFLAYNTVTAIKAMFTFFLIAVFDATGTLIGLLNPTVFKQQENYSKRLSNSLTADAAASTLAGLIRLCQYLTLY